MIAILAPVFALVLLGWALRKLGWLPADMARHLNLFVFSLALPALLFRMIADTSPERISNLPFIAAILLPALLTMATGAFVARTFRGHTPAPVIGFAAANPNTAIIGLPLCLLALGESAAAPAAVTNVLTGCVLMPVAVFAMSMHGEGKDARRVVRAVAANPLFIACAGGVMASVSGWRAAGVLDDALAMLARSATPTALIALGLFLGDLKLRDHARLPATLCLLKLVAQPALAAGICILLAIPEPWRATAILMSALPTATGTLSIVDAMRRPAEVVGQTILLSTALSLVTILIVLSAL